MKVPTETVGSMIWSLNIVYLFVVFLSVGHIWVTCLMMVRRQPACVTVSTLHLSNSNPVVRFDSLGGDWSCFQGVDSICCQNRINLTLSLLGMIMAILFSFSLSPEIYYTVWRTWHLVACSDESWLNYQFSLHHSYLCSWMARRICIYELGSERVNPSPFLCFWCTVAP